MKLGFVWKLDQMIEWPLGFGLEIDNQRNFMVEREREWRFISDMVISQYPIVCIMAIIELLHRYFSKAPSLRVKMGDLIRNDLPAWTKKHGLA